MSRNSTTLDDMTVLVLSHPAEPQLAMLEALPDKTTIAVGNTVEAFDRAAPDTDIIFNWSANLELFQNVWHMTPRVRWVHARSAGLDGVLFPALAESPVPLTNGRGVFSESLAEFVVGTVLFFAKDFRRMVRSQMAGLWDQFDTVEIQGQTIGFVGYGDIGRACARRAHALGMKILALKRTPENPDDHPPVAGIFTPERKHEFLASCDYVVITAPLTAASRGMIGGTELAAMRPNAVLINIGRGPIVDEAALIAALQQKRIRGAALDVFNTEPLPPEHPFYRLENLLLSPHAADHTPDWKERAMQLFLENFERFRHGEPLLNVVNKKLGY